jgi:hypothetical protein
VQRSQTERTSEQTTPKTVEQSLPEADTQTHTSNL